MKDIIFSVVISVLLLLALGTLFLHETDELIYVLSAGAADLAVAFAYLFVAIVTVALVSVVVVIWSEMSGK